MTTKNDKVWKDPDLAKTFLENVRDAIPMASDQIDTMLRIIEAAAPHLEKFLDIGCGDGILGEAILDRYPDAKGVFYDLSESMIDSAKTRLEKTSRKQEFLVGDFQDSRWTYSVLPFGPFDTVVSGFSIHHQTDERKKGLYEEILGLLKPGGLFLNLEHVSSCSGWVETIFDNMFIDSLYERHKYHGSTMSRDETAGRYYNRTDKQANILAPVEKQCAWLRDMGYENVDCYFRIFELALFGGTRPAD